MGTELRKSGSLEPSGDAIGAASEAAVVVEACLLALAPKAVALNLDNVLHGETSVDFMDGQRSVVSAAMFCR